MEKNFEMDYRIDETGEVYKVQATGISGRWITVKTSESLEEIIEYCENKGIVDKVF